MLQTAEVEMAWAQGLVIMPPLSVHVRRHALKFFVVRIP